MQHQTLNQYWHGKQAKEMWPTTVPWFWSTILGYFFNTKIKLLNIYILGFPAFSQSNLHHFLELLFPLFRKVGRTAFVVMWYSDLLPIHQSSMLLLSASTETYSVERSRIYFHVSCIRPLYNLMFSTLLIIWISVLYFDILFHIAFRIHVKSSCYLM